jgi:hypothetical protein
LIEFKHRYIKFYEYKTIQDCISQIEHLLLEEKINESSKNDFLEAIKCLKKHEDEIRVLRQELEAQLRLYNNKMYLNELIDKGKISL